MSSTIRSIHGSVHRALLRALLAALALAGLAPALAPLGAAEVVLVIRTGALDPAELAPTSARTPHLRRLALSGALLTRVSAGRPIGGDAAAADATLERLFPEAGLARLREDGVSIATIDTRAPAVTAPLAVAGGETPPEERHALERLHAAFAEPPAATDAELAAKRVMRHLIGIDESGDGTSDATAEAAEILTPLERVVERVTSALEKGVRLVVVLEHVEPAAAAVDETDGETAAPQPWGLPERDGLIGALGDMLAARPSTSVVTLLVPPTGNAAAIARGGRVRDGWIVTRAYSLEDLAATVLALAGSAFEDSPNRGIAIHDILRP